MRRPREWPQETCWENGVDRRHFMALTGAAALGSRPALAQASTTTLRFVPVSDLSVLDPVLTSTYITRNHAYMVFDHLYGLDEQLQVQPQMADGHRLEKDGRRGHDPAARGPALP